MTTALRLSLVCLVLSGIGFLLPFDAARAAGAACFVAFVLLLGVGLGVEPFRAGASSLRRGFRAGPRATGLR